MFIAENHDWSENTKYLNAIVVRSLEDYNLLMDKLYTLGFAWYGNLRVSEKVSRKTFDDSSKGCYDHYVTNYLKEDVTFGMVIFISKKIKALGYGHEAFCLEKYKMKPTELSNFIIASSRKKPMPTLPII